MIKIKSRFSSGNALFLFLIIGILAGYAWAETVELVTYYPSSSNTGNQHLQSLTVGTDFEATPTPPLNNGAAFIVGPVGIGTTNPQGPLHVVGADDAISNVIFSSGADNAGVPGTPGIRVGIGTAAPAYALDVAGASGARISANGQSGIYLNTPSLAAGNGGLALGFNRDYDSTNFTNTGYIQAESQNVAFRNLVLNPLGGNVGIGTAAPAASAALDLTSTTKGFLPPRMITAERNAIAGPVAGLIIYNTTTNQLNLYNGTAWTTILASVSGSVGLTTQVVFGTAGATNWTVPAGVTGVTVEVWGGGGGGGGSPNAGGAQFGHGGGGGGYGRQLATVTPGAVLTITVGAGGTGQKTNSNTGGNGGTSSVTGLNVPPAVSATGGRGGSSGGIEGAIVGRGGTSTATFNISGQDAIAPFFTLYQRAGGSGGNGGAGSVGELNSSRFIGTDGVAPGGGGCGWFARSPSGSNNGAVGRVVITYSS